MEWIQKLRDLSFPSEVHGFSFTEYLAVFMGLIFALAVAEFFLTVGHMIRDRHRFNFYWEFYLWLFVLLDLFIVTWYVQWTRMPFLDLGLKYFVLLCMPNLFVFLIVAVFFPSLKGEGPVDVKAHFLSIVKPLFYLLACFIGSLLLAELLLDTEIGQIARYGQMLYVAFALVNAIWPRLWLRAVFLGVLFIQMNVQMFIL